MDKLYLGIDQSYTNTGWCVMTSRKNIVDCGVIRTSKDDDIFTRANYITTQLGGLVQKYVPEIAIEGLAYGMTGSATRDLAGLQFVIICHLQILKYKARIIAPKSIKMHAFKALNDDTMKAKEMKKKQNMYKALPQSAKNQIEPYKFLKTKGLYDVTDAWWLCAAIIDEDNK